MAGAMPYAILPEVGNQPSLSENTMIPIMPNQKAGMDIPKKDAVIPKRSMTEFWYRAEAIPRGIPTTRANNSENNANSMVAGTASRITSFTGRAL